jgi:hypothetical protein
VPLALGQCSERARGARAPPRPGFETRDGVGVSTGVPIGAIQVEGKGPRNALLSQSIRGKAAISGSPAVARRARRNAERNTDTPGRIGSSRQASTREPGTGACVTRGETIVETAKHARVSVKKITSAD